jgi:hypothetical protein
LSDPITFSALFLVVRCVSRLRKRRENSDSGQWRAHELLAEISHAPGVGGQHRQLYQVFLQDSIHRSERDPLPDYSDPKGEKDLAVQIRHAENTEYIYFTRPAELASDRALTNKTKQCCSAWEQNR